MKTPTSTQSQILSPAEVGHLQRFVNEVRTLIASDVEGLLVDLYEPAEISAEILGMQQQPEPEDEEEKDERR